MVAVADDGTIQPAKKTNPNPPPQPSGNTGNGVSPSSTPTVTPTRSAAINRLIAINGGNTGPPGVTTQTTTRQTTGQKNFGANNNLSSKWSAALGGPNFSTVGALSLATKNGLVPPGPPNGVPTVADLHQAIQGFSHDQNIPFSYTPDGCYARADIMSSTLDAQGIPTGKSWAFADMGKPLDTGTTQWGYHVATTADAYNPKTGLVQKYVIDPSLSGKPMTPDQWVQKMGKTGTHDPSVTMDYTGNNSYVPNYHYDPATGKPVVDGYLSSTDPTVSAYDMTPTATMNRYSNVMTSNGLKPNSGPPDGIPTNADIAASGDISTLAKIGNVATRGLGVVGVVGGGIQAFNGVQELRQGKTLDGSLDTASGVLNAAGGAAMATGVGAVAAPFLFGAGSVVDGAHDIINGVKSGNGEKIGVGTAKAVGGGMMIAGGVLCATGIGAPVGVGLIVAGGVVAGGAALYDTFHNQINGAVSTAAHAVGNAVGTAASAVGNATHTVANAVGTAASNVGNAAKSVWNFVTSW